METIKEEKKADLEQLLNSLIEKGWKPFGITCTDFIKGTGLECIPSYCFNPHPHMWFPWWTRKYHRPSLRQIASKESWLWQFVCENHLYIYEMWENKNFIQDHFKNEYNECCYQYLWDKSCYEYYLLESSLKDDSELEEFLLSNIKIDVESK